MCHWTILHFSLYLIYYFCHKSSCFQTGNHEFIYDSLVHVTTIRFTSFDLRSVNIVEPMQLLYTCLVGLLICIGIFIFKLIMCPLSVRSIKSVLHLSLRGNSDFFCFQTTKIILKKSSYVVYSDKFDSSSFIFSTFLWDLNKFILPFQRGGGRHFSCHHLTYSFPTFQFVCFAESQYVLLL